VAASGAAGAGAAGSGGAPRRAPAAWHAAAWGLLGVLGFSFSLPATRLAVEDLDPTFVGLGRALVAAVLAGALLAWRREPVPDRRDLPRFAIVGLGVVIGFPLTSSLALKHLSSAHASVVVGLLPAATAAWAVARAGERPPRAFWLAAAAGLVAVLAFAATQGIDGLAGADLLVLASVALGGLGYAEGGALSRRYGGWQVICWALLLTAPLLVVPVALAARGGLHATPSAWLCFAYVSVVSMFLGFFAWYHGLALGGVAKIGQVQLAQPVMTLAWAALILGEQVTAAMLVAALAVLACVLATQRTRRAASGDDERGRRRALDSDGDGAQRAPLPRGGEHAEDDDVVDDVPVPVPARQHPLAPESEPLQRGL
jgi:drug/metabolite transporter (DMT)-like permease